jgi:hypothetical protein
MAVSTEAAEKVYADHFDIPTTLAAWQISSTTADAVKLFENGAAILPNSVIADEDLPRVKVFRTIMLAIGREIRKPDRETYEGYYVADLLRDIDFQHHQSTNGLWNPELGRWERWGARDLDGWLKPQVNDPKMKAKEPRRIHERTFRRIKEDLIALGLIEQKRKLFPPGRTIWLKPTPELSRILFEPGYWEQVRDKYAPAKAKEKKTTKKPRGNSAHHNDNVVLYRQVIMGELPDLTEEMKKTIWGRLTKPVVVSEKYTMKPFVQKGSERYITLMKALWPK